MSTILSFIVHKNLTRNKPRVFLSALPFIFGIKRAVTAMFTIFIEHLLMWEMLCWACVPSE